MTAATITLTTVHLFVPGKNLVCSTAVAGGEDWVPLVFGHFDSPTHLIPPIPVSGLRKLHVFLPADGLPQFRQEPPKAWF
jgi:hypothetical protein